MNIAIYCSFNDFQWMLLCIRFNATKWKFSGNKISDECEEINQMTSGRVLLHLHKKLQGLAFEAKINQCNPSNEHFRHKRNHSE